jgi:hypothetical protein
VSMVALSIAIMGQRWRLYKKKKGLDETSLRSVEAAISGIEL